MTLCGYDLVYLISSLFIFALPLLWPAITSNNFFPYSITYLLPIAHVGMTGKPQKKDFSNNNIYFIPGSIYTTMAITIERYITVCHPFFKISLNWSPKKYIIPILIFSWAYNVPKFLELEVKKIIGKIIHIN